MKLVVRRPEQRAEELVGTRRALGGDAEHALRRRVPRDDLVAVDQYDGFVDAPEQLTDAARLDRRGHHRRPGAPNRGRGPDLAYMPRRLPPSAHQSEPQTVTS